MTHVDMLSDTTYREQAVRQLHQLLGNASEFPVESTQIYGLRQIARQQPGKVAEFARHQGARAKKLKHQAEVGFWTLVVNLCGDLPDHWSVKREGHRYLPVELRDENRREVPGATPQETEQNQQHNNRLRTGRRGWLEEWENEHIPAFFERFCTHCLYYIAKSEMGQLGSGNTNETDQLSQQEQNNSQDGGAMQTALQQVNLVE